MRAISIWHSGFVHYTECIKRNRTLNVFKTETILFRHLKKRINYDLKLKLHGKRLCLGQKTKYLGVHIDENLNWKTQLNEVAKKLRRANGIISKLRHFLPLKTMVQVYHALFQSHINYGLQIWAQNLLKKKQILCLQKSAIRLMTFFPLQTPSDYWIIGLLSTGINL